MTLAPPPVSAVVLDMDGTLLDLYFDDRVWNHALPHRIANREGMALADAAAFVAETIGAARGTLAWYCLDHWTDVFRVSIHALEEEQASYIQIRDGTVDFLEHLRAQQIPAILATNAHPASMRRKLAKTGLAPYFSALRSSHEYGAPKEHAAFWAALQADLGIDPASVIFVDDNVGVLDAARAWGIAELYGVFTPSSRGERKVFDDYPAVELLSELNGRCVGPGPVARERSA